MSKVKFIIHIREYENDHTEGNLFVEDDWFCHVLEDVGRPDGVKIVAETCIPEGIYNVEISRSTRFKKDMLLLSNTSEKTVVRKGVRFTGVRAHGGNTVDNTEGCPLLNFNTDERGKQWGRASDDLLTKVRGWIDSGYEVKWVISSK